MPNTHNTNIQLRIVYFGPRTIDEMCFCFFRYTVDREHRTQDGAVEDHPLEIAL